jgi:hypothetical protein
VIADALHAVREQLARAAERSGRRAADVTLLGVSKTHPAESVRAAFDAGLTDAGENKVQEAEGKIAALHDLRPRLRWHLVGHLQGNKARRAAGLFDLIHSLDSIALAEKLEHGAAELHRPLDALVQVDLAGEATKHGVPEAGLFPLLEFVRGLKSLRAVGLMILPPLSDDPEASRPFFRKLRGLRETALRDGLLLGTHLSMGMSHDFEVAIEEGATIVRVGTALFGARG